MKKNLKQILLIGDLEKIQLRSSSFEVEADDVKQGIVTIKIDYEFRFNQSFDKFMIVLTTALEGKTEQETPFFKANCVMVGMYAADESFEEYKDQLLDSLTIRGSMQIFPVVRAHLAALLSQAGINVNNILYDPTVLTMHTAKVQKRKKETKKKRPTKNTSEPIFANKKIKKS